MSGTELQLFRPDGKQFATYVELAAMRKQERIDKEQAQQQLEQERERSQKLAARLQELGIDPNQV